MKAFLFPGQGSQTKGMGLDLFNKFPDLVRQTDEVLGYSIRELCLEDPGKQLGQTQFTQPALYVVNALSYLKEIEESGQKPDFTAGHSLGEFNALLAAECFDFETGLKLVKKRGELMSRAGDGGMAAVINATKEEIQCILRENGLENIDLANYNTPSQIVISGLRDEIAKARPLFQEGKMMYFPLNTSGAFHSRFMGPVKDEFESYLNEFSFSGPEIPVISNVTACPYRDGEIIGNLANQITGSIRWYESIQYMMHRGCRNFREIGHGNVLTKMIRKIDPPEAVETQGVPQGPPPGIGHPGAPGSKGSALSAREKVDAWNLAYPVGTVVEAANIGAKGQKTRTRAMVLFDHRPAVYLEGYNGYFDLDELLPQ